MESWYRHGLMLYTWNHGNRHGLMVLTTPMVLTYTYGKESVLLNNTCMRGISVACMRFIYLSVHSMVSYVRILFFLDQI